MYKHYVEKLQKDESVLKFPNREGIKAPKEAEAYQQSMRGEKTKQSPYRQKSKQKYDEKPKELNLHPVYQNDIFNKLHERFNLGDKGAKNFKNRMEKLHTELHSEPYQHGDVHNIQWGNKEKLKSKGLWNTPMPIPTHVDPEKTGGVLGRGVASGEGSDPFMRMDSKYKTGLEAIKSHKGKPLEINTRSDLIANDKYMNELDPKNHTINIHFMTDNDGIGRILEPDAPSLKSRLKAFEKLKNAGFKVNLIHNKLKRDGKNYKFNTYDPQKMWRATGGNLDSIKTHEHDVTDEAHNRIKENLGPHFNKSEKTKTEKLEKKVSDVVKPIVGLAGLAHGAAYMGHMDSPKQQAAQQFTKPQITQQRNVAAEPKKEDKTGNFLNNISMIESSGGKNLKHAKMNEGIHAGQKAIGKYGLMPNTIKETTNRMALMGELPKELKQYQKMNPKFIGESLKNNPKHEEAFARNIADRLLRRHGGDEERAAFSWNQGTNIPSYKFNYNNYQKHPYVQKYNKFKGLSNTK